MKALRVVRAVLVSYLVAGVLALGAMLMLMAAFGVRGGEPLPPAFVVTNLLASVLAAMVGGYLCARLAPEGRVTVSVAVLFLGTLAAGAVYGRAMATPTEPLWYQAVFTLLAASGLLVGAVIQRATWKRR
jgi:hypothetical protein